MPGRPLFALTLKPPPNPPPPNRRAAAQVKTRQLKKLFEKYNGKKAELGDLQEGFQREREGVLEDYRILTQQIKLKNLIIACFIPPDYQDKIMQHCHWQDYDASWNIDCMQYAGECNCASAGAGGGAGRA